MNIEEYLISLNFSINSGKGFQYWIEALEYCKDRTFFKIGDIYRELAKKHTTTWSAIEAAMRYSAIEARKTIESRYKLKYEMTNKSMLRFLRIRLKE